MANPILIPGDCLREIPTLADHSIHAVCTDPPYGLLEFSKEEIEKLRSKRGGIWRIPPRFDGCVRKPLPRFTILNDEQKKEIQCFFVKWGETLFPKLRPGGHVLIAGNSILQQFVQTAMASVGFENRAVIIRLYHGFRGGDRPKNAEKEYPEVCVTPRGNYEPWMLFRKPLSESTVSKNLKRWGTGGLRMLVGGKPLPDVIESRKTPAIERRIVDHPSLKPQHLLRILVRTLLPLGEGVILDPFMGSGSTLAAATAIGYESIGMEIDLKFFASASRAIKQLALLYPHFTGGELWDGSNVPQPVAATHASLFDDFN